jgi:hypothetical protein
MEEGGAVHRMSLSDHHAVLSRINLQGDPPGEVQLAFDRACSVFLYAYFDYGLLVVGEIQALGSVELALKHRLNGHGGQTKETMRNLVDRARKEGILPRGPRPGDALSDPIEAMIAMRNGLSHGTADTHSPGMAFQVLESCAHAIDLVFPCQGTPA